MFSRIAAILLALGATAVHGQSAALGDDETAVIVRAYSLTRTGGLEKTIVLPVETANFRCTGDSGVKLGGCSGAMRTDKISTEEVFAWLSKEFASVAGPEVLADFRSKAEFSARVAKLPIEVKQIIGEPPAKDDAGRPYLLLDFSRVGFNPAKTEAIVYVASVSQVDPRRSFGEYLCFRLDNNVWKIAARARNWALK
ncbi:MAG TPA: hypothetical protein VKR38_06300 [Usitatibacter sp.]|nr:hypothetical protein [Usitatibacter sp.]